MRTSLLPGPVETLRTNVNRKIAARAHLRGRAHLPSPRRRASSSRCAWAGSPSDPPLPEQWGEPRRATSTSSTSRATSRRWPRRAASSTEPFAHPALHPGRCGARVGRRQATPAGWASCTRACVRHFDLPKAPVVFELDLDALTDGACRPAEPVSRVPVVRRDLALVVDEKLPAQDAARRAGAGQAGACHLARTVRRVPGPGLTDGRKSLAILVLMQDTSRTLTDADIDATEALLLSVARDKFGATLRQ